MQKLNPEFSLNLDLADINQAALQFTAAFDKHITSSI
jgi:hypothetical protein